MRRWPAACGAQAFAGRDAVARRAAGRRAAHRRGGAGAVAAGDRRSCAVAAVDALTARLGTPAFTLGRQRLRARGRVVDDGAGARGHSRRAAARRRRRRRAGGADGRAEREAHSILRRLGPLDGFAVAGGRSRARVGGGARGARSRAAGDRAAAGAGGLRGDRTPPSTRCCGEAQRLADALVVLLERGATRSELQRVLGPEGDAHAARVRATAMHALGGRRVGGGRDARTALAERIGGDVGGQAAAGIAARRARDAARRFVRRRARARRRRRRRRGADASARVRSRRARTSTSATASTIRARRRAPAHRARADPRRAAGGRGADVGADGVAGGQPGRARGRSRRRTRSPTARAPARSALGFASGRRPARSRATPATAPTPSQWRMNRHAARARPVAAADARARSRRRAQADRRQPERRAHQHPERHLPQPRGDKVDSGTLAASIDAGALPRRRGQLSVDSGGRRLGRADACR